MRRAFTLVELLIVIGIIALLLGLALPSLRGARDVAKMSKELSLARQMMIAYQLRTEDHKGYLMAGYPPAPAINDAPLAYDEVGNPVQAPASRRYPWRFLSYLDFNLEGLYTEKSRIEEMREEDLWGYHYAVSVAPSLGLNQSFVGGSADGDRTSVAFNPQAREVWGSGWYAKKESDVERPSMLMVFASAQSSFAVEGGVQLNGSYKVTPPYFVEREWDLEPPSQVADGASATGNISLRHQGKAVVGLFDGHAEAFDWEQMQDMRHWAPIADMKDWTLPDPRSQ